MVLNRRVEECKEEVVSFKTVKDALGDKVEKIVVFTHITDSPCVLITSQFEWMQTSSES